LAEWYAKKHVGQAEPVGPLLALHGWEVRLVDATAVPYRALGRESHAEFGNPFLSFHAALDIIILGLVLFAVKVCQIHLVGFFATRLALGYRDRLMLLNSSIRCE
jgi:hypothetical protein